MARNFSDLSFPCPFFFFEALYASPLVIKLLLLSFSSAAQASEHAKALYLCLRLQAFSLMGIFFFLRAQFVFFANTSL